jgi:hypothetical protein
VGYLPRHGKTDLRPYNPARSPDMLTPDAIKMLPEQQQDALL